MEAATPEAHPAQPVPRDPELPDVSDAALCLFAAGALLATAVALVMLVLA